MATQTQTTNAGPVGLKPKGAYQQSANYTLLDLVRHGYESWVCTAINQDGTAGTITGEAPSATAQHWMALTDFTVLITAVNTSADNADVKASLANSAAQSASTQADRAKAMNDHPWEIRDDGYIWAWDETHDNGDGTTGAMVRKNKMIIGFNDLTTEQRQSLIDQFYAGLVFASVSEAEAAARELT